MHLLPSLSVTLAGRSSPWAQPILHYERKRVLHSARRSGLHDRSRDLFFIFFSSPSAQHGAPLRVITSPLWPLSPCAARTAGAAVGVFVRFVPLRGACAPRYYYAAPQCAGLSSSRGSRRGEISTRLQSERSYRRGGVSKRRSRGVAISGSPILRRRAAPTGCKVPDGVSHLFPCTAGVLFPEANSLLLHPAPYPCPALCHPRAAHARLRG